MSISVCFFTLSPPLPLLLSLNFSFSRSFYLYLCFCVAICPQPTYTYLVFAFVSVWWSMCVRVFPPLLFFSFFMPFHYFAVLWFFMLGWMAWEQAYVSTFDAFLCLLFPSKEPAVISFQSSRTWRTLIDNNGQGKIRCKGVKNPELLFK